MNNNNLKKQKNPSFGEGAIRGLFESMLVRKFKAIILPWKTEKSNKFAPQRLSIGKADKCKSEAFSERSHIRILVCCLWEESGNVFYASTK